jgi:predicted nuclease with TOPRIM domain
MLMEPLSGTTPAEEVLRRHAEVREQIEGKQFEFGYVEELGRRLVAKGQPRDEVEERLRELERARAELEQQWQSREANYGGQINELGLGIQNIIFNI